MKITKRALLLAFLWAGCGDDVAAPDTDAGPDSMADALVDPSMDVADAAPADAASGGDAPLDAAVDAAPPPALHIDFPAAHASTTSTSIQLRGRAAHRAGIRSVEVNGEAATSTDGFATWTYEVAMDEHGRYVADVVAESGDGERAMLTRRLERRGERGDAPLTDYDENARRVFFFGGSAGNGGLSRVDLDVGVFVPMATRASVDAVAGPDIRDIRWDATRQRLLLLAPTMIYAIPVDESGTAGDIVPAIPPAERDPRMTRASAFAVDDSSGRALVQDADHPSLLSVDLLSGAARLVPAPAAPLANITDYNVSFDVDGGRLVVTAHRIRAAPGLFAFDLRNETWSSLVDNTGLSFGDPTFLDAPTAPLIIDGDIYFYDRGDVLRFREADGSFTRVAETPLGDVRRLASDSEDASLLLADRTQLARLDPAAASVETIASDDFPFVWGNEERGERVVSTDDELIVLTESAVVAARNDGFQVLVEREEALGAIYLPEDDSLLVLFGDLPQSLVRIDMDADEVTDLGLIAPAGLDEPYYLDSDAGLLFINDESNVWEYDLGTRSGRLVPELMSPSFTAPGDGVLVGLAAGEGELVVAYWDGTETLLYSLDLESRAVRTLRGPGAVGPALGLLRGFARVEGGALWAAQEDQLLRIDEGGTSTLVASRPAERLYAIGSSLFGASGGPALWQLDIHTSTFVTLASVTGGT